MTAYVFYNNNGCYMKNKHTKSYLLPYTEIKEYKMADYIEGTAKEFIAEIEQIFNTESF